ncbi:fimbria/pilus periplasmic chaperone [Scandinavium goeteborgense]|uniref:fimbria/pilus periplasmic chaperone n=1 Tax=Scandinavium goeteborgense TaxID=1851514 RepID=UPI000F678E65|nr:fimbria/pilus periplasmic chaperone [Scandinavium goeteborgense]QKN79772.1 fimbria/pilus periplasmic chaperone [Scandinavium goeteborgense]
MNKKHLAIIGGLAGMLYTQFASAAIALDRTRIIYDGANRSVSVAVSNENKDLPYLAQSWLEDDKGNKISTPIAALPPIQRIDAGGKSQIKLQALPEVNSLPQDRESVYYFNLREIPPRSNKPNTLQIALQTRIKLFYRPKAIAVKQSDAPWQEKLTLSYAGGKAVAKNPTAYYVTLIDVKKNGKTIEGFQPMMVPPKGEATIPGNSSDLGNAPVLTYVNDFGGRPTMKLQCNAGQCHVVESTNN